MKKGCVKWVPHFLTGTHNMERARCAKQMLAMFEPQGLKQLTCYRRWNFHKLLWHSLKTGKYAWCGSMKPGTDQSSSDWISEQEAALHYIFQPRWNPDGRHSAREDNNDQPPLHRNTTAKGCCACPGAVTTHGTTSTLLHHDNAAPHKARATIQHLEGGKVQVLPHL